MGCLLFIFKFNTPPRLFLLCSIVLLKSPFRQPCPQGSSPLATSRRPTHPRGTRKESPSLLPRAGYLVGRPGLGR